MRRFAIALWLLTGCDPRSYPVGTAPAPDGAVPNSATGGSQGRAAATGGDSGSSGTGGGMVVSGVAACSVPEGNVVDRPVTIPADVLAERLARFLWDAPPDDGVKVLATAGKTSEMVKNIADVMIADGRFVGGIDALARDWLKVDGVAAAIGAEEIRSMVDADLRASMQAETITFVRDVVLSGGSISTLLSAPYTFVDPRLAALYGLPPVTPGAFVRVEDEQRRSGVLTQGSLMFTRPRISMRGMWVVNDLMCLGLPPPPAGDFGLMTPLRQPGQTDRQWIEAETQSPGCGACHKLIDPTGFAFEHYDALGRWRDNDNGKPIDASGSLEEPPLKFDGVRQLAQQLAGSCQVQRCVIQAYLQRATGAPDTGDTSDRNALLRAFVASGMNLKALFAQVAASAPFLAP